MAVLNYDMYAQGTLQTQDYGYQGAVNASMQFYAAQRSGSLEGSSNIPSWRGDSGLGDLPVGGYYLGTSKAQSLSYWQTIRHAGSMP